MKVAAFGYYGRGNVGDEIFLQTLQNNRYNIRFEAPSKIVAHRTGINRLLSSSEGYLRKVLPSKLRTKYLETVLKDFDSVLLGPGGIVWLSGFHPWFESLYDVLKDRRIPLHCYGLGVEPADLGNKPRSLDNKVLEKWKLLLGLSETVHVRDNFSKELLQVNAIHDHVLVVNDIAFAYPLPPSSKPAEKIVGINLRTRFVGDTEIFVDKRQLVDLIDFFTDAGYKISLIPFQERPSKKGTENDLVILEDILRITKHKSKVRIVSNTSPSEILQHIGSLDFFIGTRYHSIIFALRYGIPTCAIAYRPKVRSLMEEYYQLGDYVVTPAQVSKIKDLFMDREKIRHRALAKTPEIEKTTNLQLDSFLQYLLVT
jgi:polysaccharide pyruvyl transferase WcaK-like protein